ncbi:chemotaxis protein CheB [Candidatus Kapaibacterium sp.]
MAYKGRKVQHAGENQSENINLTDKTQSANNDFAIVGIGASAGGLEALEQFFKHIKPDSGLAYVVVQHLSPDYKSLMVELLSKHTLLPIYRAEDGMYIAKNSIYLIPPKKNLTIFHRKLYLTDQIQNLGLNLPIDVFFRSLAEDLGEKSIGIVLSGTGSDGTLGIRAIKGAGGMVMVQDEETAKFDGMPKSAISTGLVDYILPPEMMGEQLSKYIEHPLVSASERANTITIEDDDILSKILLTIRSRTGVDFTYYKPNTIVRRIERRISVHQIANIEDYYRLLSDSPTEANVLYKELLIGVTKFFRDYDAFELIRFKAIPEIIGLKKAGESIRVWVAGCSTGEEAYSLAMFFHDYMNVSGKVYDIKIFATDIDRDAIEYASAGIYPESIVTDVNEDFLKKYFVKNGQVFKVVDTIRQMVIFATHNIIKDPPFSKIDMISCRNLLIYLQPIMQKKVLSSFSFSLNTGGIMFLGSSESIGDLASFFTPVEHKWKIYKSNINTKQVVIDELYIPSIKSKKSLPVNDIKSKLSSDADLFESISKDLFSSYVPPSIIINDKYELVHVFKDANRYLKIPSGKISLNILNLVPGELSVALSTAIHKVLKDNNEIKYSNVTFTKDEELISLDLKVKLFKQGKNQTNLLLVVFDEKPVIGEQDGVDNVFEMDSNLNLRLQDIENELKYTKENLQATIEELETSNEELQATNEELIASNEELQSINEELQSVNEELYTVNSEYQNKIEELTELNNDNNNWFNVTNIGTVFLDMKLRVRKFTPATVQFVNLIDDDMGRPISHISYNFDFPDFFNEINKTLKTLKPYEVELKSRDDEWFLMKIIPYRTIENAVKGVVITFTDIHKIKEYEDLLALDNDFLINVLDVTKDSEVMLNENGEVIYINQAAKELLEIDDVIADKSIKVEFFDLNTKKQLILNSPFRQILENKSPIHNYSALVNINDEFQKEVVLNGIPMLNTKGAVKFIILSFSAI